MSKIKVLVLFGGVSSEHEISCRSAEMVIKNIDSSRFELIKIGITKKGHWLYYPDGEERLTDGSWEFSPDCLPAFLSPDSSHAGIFICDEGGRYRRLKVDVVFPVLHGKNGEDGTLQGLLTMAGIPFVGSGSGSSAACMDKYITNVVTENVGIPHCKYEMITRQQLPLPSERLTDIIGRLGLPVFVKPSCAGSSVGVTRVDNSDGLVAAILTAAAHDNRILIEEAVEGTELECAVLGGQLSGGQASFASAVGEIVPGDSFYSYDDKYHNDSPEQYVPARIPQEISDKIRELALKTFDALNCMGLARVDFFWRKSDGEILLNEINTIPGFTSISMYPKLMAYSGIDNRELISRLIDLALEAQHG